MKPENIGNLLYYYIQEKRTYDDVDSPVAKESGNLSAEYDEPRPFHFDGDNFEEMPFHQVSNEPSPPIAFHFAPLSPEQQNIISTSGKKLVEMTTEFFANRPERSVVEFKNSCLIVSPGKQTVSIPILRSPDCDDVPLTIQWKTYDKTALSGTHYVGAEGEILLERGEKEKEIQVEILSTKANADLRFLIELAVQNSYFAPKPMTVNIQNIKNFEADEQKVIENLLESKPTSVSDMMFILEDHLSMNTFRSGLSYFCSKADSLPLEFGLALEFSRICLQGRRLRCEPVINTLRDFFRSVELPDDF